jgi:O-antigen ligase
LMVYAFWSRRPSNRLLVLLVVLCVQLVATGSRTALLAGGAAFVVFELLRRQYRSAALAISVGTALWLLVPTLGARTAEMTIDSGMGSQVNLSGRAILWADAWVSFIGNGSLLGHGLGATEAFFESRYLGLSSVHNGYLLLLGDTGVIGLGLVLTFLFGICFLFARQCWSVNTGCPIYEPLSVGLVVMLLLASFMESTFGGYGPLTPLWCAMGAAFAFRTPADGKP